MKRIRLTKKKALVAAIAVVPIAAAAILLPKAVKTAKHKKSTAV